jgi:hypothetical protein
LHEPLGLVDRHHPQDYGIDKAEDRSIGADPESQRHNRGRCE